MPQAILNGLFRIYMIEIIKHINESWSWTGLSASHIIQINDFGNIIIEDKNGHIWRLCPEDLSCTVIAENSAEFEILKKSEEFIIDWEMKNLIEMAYSKLGALSTDRKYCLKIPSILGGTYTSDNLGIIKFLELISASGSLALQIKDLPNGSEVKLIVTD